MTEQQALTRCVEAFERIATALETMARQQGEFLATMPAEDVVIPEGFTAESFVVTADPVPRHAYDATCACQACWATRRKAKAEGSP